MKKIIGLAALIFLIFGCCPTTGAVQTLVERVQNEILALMDAVNLPFQEELPPIAIVPPSPTVPPDPTATQVPQTVVGIISPCEGIYEKYPHDPSLGEISEVYIGSWHADYSMSDAYKERFVLFASGNYLFFPDQYECRNTFKTCVPSPIEDGLWGVHGQVMNFARGGDLNDIISRSITEIVPSPVDESPYPYKTTIDGLKFWLWSKETDYWDPETGDYCGW